MADLDRENERRKLEIAQQREQLTKRLEYPYLQDDERKQLLAQMEQFEKNLKDQLQSETDQQATRLKEALNARRSKRQNLT